jgi:peptidyl-prolyl cis-trans isomerase C
MAMKNGLIGTALVAAVLVAGCGRDEAPEAKDADKTRTVAPAPSADEIKKDPNDVLVAVAGATLKRGEAEKQVDEILAARAKQGQALPKEQEAFIRSQGVVQIAQQFMVETLLVQKAEKLGYKVTEADIKEREETYAKSAAGRPDAPKTLKEAMAQHPLGEERARRDFERGVLIDKMLKGEALSKVEKDFTAEAKAIVDGIVAENAKCRGEEAALEKIAALKTQIDKAADADKAAKFAELAKAESECPSAAQGGDLGQFGRQMMVKEFEEVAFTQAVGQVSAPVKTQFGYHLILTTAREPAENPEKVQASHILVKTAKPQEVPALETVAEFLKKQNEREAVNVFITAAIREAAPMVHDELKSILPPPEMPQEAPAVEMPAEK